MGLDMYLEMSKNVTPDDLVDVGYWRKFNALHKWFVDNVQNGEDGGDRYKVSKEQLTSLLKTLKKVNKENCEGILPTQGGFFFGSTDYDDYYFEHVKEAIKIISEVLKSTNFEKSSIFYYASR